MSSKKILVIDDEKLIRWSLSQKMAPWGMSVIEAENGKEAVRLAQEESPDLVMMDMRLPDARGLDLLDEFKKSWPDIPVVMITAYGIIDDAVAAMRKGAYDFITKPIDYAKLQSTVKNALEIASLKKEVAYYREKEKKQFDLSQVVAVSAQMKETLEIAKKIAASEATIVLLQGESGTGKDILAHAVHHLSRRKDAPFLIINCSAIPENLLESELFGHEKGAFTDAQQQKKGLAETVDGGSLFLDEISTLNLHLQAKLLRFLETQTFKRVGGLKDIEVDIRIIAATNQKLEEAVRFGKFRSDLFYRLNVCPIFLSPLRDRKADILPLAHHFIDQYNNKFRKKIQGLAAEAEREFLVYDWPGNVRELKNAVERAMIFEDEPFIRPQYLPIPVSAGPITVSPDDAEKIPADSLSLPDMEKALLVQALRKASGNQTRAARLLKISRDALRYKIKKFKITPDTINWVK
jgi:two-component system response regulator AtoC